MNAPLAGSVVAVILSLLPFASHAQENSERAELLGQATADVAVCMSLAYKLGLALSAYALGGSREAFEQALRVSEERGRLSFDAATKDLAEFDTPRQESELAQKQERFFGLLAAAREWNDQSENAQTLIEQSRQLGEQLETLCTQISLLDDEELTGMQGTLAKR